jgi:hypothetical protein
MRGALPWRSIEALIEAQRVHHELEGQLGGSRR